jgi:hypothetical protein
MKRLSASHGSKNTQGLPNPFDEDGRYVSVSMALPVFRRLKEIPCLSQNAFASSYYV